MQAEPVREPDRDSRRLHQPHDSLFKALLEEPERVSDLLRKHLPVGVRELLADEPPVLADGIFVDGGLAGSQSDRVFRVALREGCEHEYLYVILEHKSRVDPGTALKAVGYATRILEREAAGGARKLRNLPPVIVLVLYHGKGVWSAPVSL